jgi:hypothetical protein
VKLAANVPLALLHIRCLADERIGTGWSDKREEQPKMWGTAPGALRLHRWTHDSFRIRTRVNRLPTRFEILSRLRVDARTES